MMARTLSVCHQASGSCRNVQDRVSLPGPFAQDPAAGMGIRIGTEFDWTPAVSSLPSIHSILHCKSEALTYLAISCS